MKKEILFICTGNYYRSRFAEILFNNWAHKLGLDYQAWSRGLHDSNRPFPISINAVNRLKSLNLDMERYRFPIKLKPHELAQVDYIILMDELEHRPMMEEYYPEWIPQVDFWQIRDVQFESPDNALPKLISQMEHFVMQLQAEKVSA
jgi:protein-tyrosine phosphatase